MTQKQRHTHLQDKLFLVNVQNRQLGWKTERHWKSTNQEAYSSIQSLKNQSNPQIY